MTDNNAAVSTEDILAYSSAGAGFEAVMANAASAGIGGVLPLPELTRFAWSVVRHPIPAASRIGRLATQLVGIGHGQPAEAPGQLDSRFRDRAWADNSLLNSVALSYLACCETVEGALDDADVDWRTRERLRLFIDNVLAAAAPTNNPLTNPAFWKEVIDTGGRSLRAGVDNLVTDLRLPTKLPSSVDQSAYRIGETIATTTGKVVRRNRIYELIQYQPRADEIDEVPVLLVSSPVNKYYLVDLEPEQSVIRAELDRGRSVFVASWVNPDASHAEIGFDDYVSSTVEMLVTVSDISGSSSSHLLGLCGGGVLAFLTAAYLAAIGQQHTLATLTIAIAVLDYDRGPSGMAYLDQKQVERAVRRAEKHGYFDARESAWSFALIRPVEGIWANAVHNYLLGKPPPAVGLLYWAADQTNLATRFGAQMMEAALDNRLTRPGGVSISGVPIDARQITVDTYVLAASTDHISPWQNCYRTVSMVGGDVTFVLAHGGHAIAIARAPGSGRASHRTGDVSGSDPQTWLSDSVDNQGSWWDHWNGWIERHTPGKRPAPMRLGNDTYPPVGDAPGEYVRRVITFPT
ncbi:MAG TPA: alpha/beta fold hydrolase [Mycobacterium sp.]|nr:alpha/beta fold hydrolase [Mycobacterium sp.]